MNDDKLEWIFASSDNQQLADRYDRWATQYDADHDGWEWIGPAKAVEQLRDLGAISTVLDAGCGTGRVGVELAATGWDGTLVGIDLSAGMLAVAAETVARTTHDSTHSPTRVHARRQTRRHRTNAHPTSLRTRVDAVDTTRTSRARARENVDLECCPAHPGHV